MIPSADALLIVDSAVYETAFNNTPFSFKHYLHQLSMFQPEALAELAKKYREKPGAERSVSYAFVYETDASRARGRIFAANHYLRKLGVNPQPPGANPGTDNAKSPVMKVVVPVRRRIVHNLEWVR